MGLARGWPSVTPTSGDVRLADVGAETPRSVYVISDDRFHRLAQRAIVAPLLPAGEPGRMPPWWISHDDSVIALERLSSIPVDRLLERHGPAPHTTARDVQRAVGWLTGTHR